MPKWLETAKGICALTAAIFGAIVYFASAEDLKRVEKQTVQTFVQFAESMDGRIDQQQLDSLNIQKYRLREELRKKPNDSLVKEDYEAIKTDIVIIQKRMDERKKK